MQLRSPRFSVVTYSLVALFAAALGLKLAAFYLPERQPNRLAVEYGTYVHDGLRQKVDWYSFSEEPFELARRARKLIFMDIGSSLSTQGQAFEPLHLEDREFLRVLSDHFVSVKVDAYEMPWVAHAISAGETALYEAGGFLVAVLDSDGMLLATTPLQPASANREPVDLLDWTEDVARLSYGDPTVLRGKIASGTAARLRADALFASEGPITLASARQMGHKWLVAIDSGKLRGIPLPVADFVPGALLECTGDDRNELAGRAALWLLTMRESPCYDQTGGGFFLQAQGGGWTAPSTGKPSGANGLLAGLYARASVALGAPFFGETARDISSWLIRSMLDPSTNLFRNGLQATKTIDDFYTWSEDDLPAAAKEIFSVDRGSLRLKPISDWESAVSQLRSAKAANQVRALRSARREKKGPLPDAAFYADQNGRTIAGLFEAGRFLEDAAIVAHAKTAYAAMASTFVQTFGDVLHATQVSGRTTAYAGDYIWTARAAIENYVATGDGAALADAERIMKRFLELFQQPSGAFLACLNSQLSYAAFATATVVVVDGYEESIESVAARNLFDLASITGDATYRKAGKAALGACGGFLEAAALPPAGCLRAAMREFAPAVLVAGPDSANRAAVIARRLPLVLCAPAVGRKAGVYIERSGSVTGPYPLERIEGMLR
jgi:uncharacterized protein YyaL (SSP411 family)